MAIDTSGFTSPQADYGGLYKAGDTLLRRKEHEENSKYRKEARQAQTTAQLSNFFDPKDYLTGTNYDPEIVKQLNEALQQGYNLTSQGASTPEIMMVLGPQISKLTQYSANAKQINQNIKLSTQRFKAEPGHNLPAIEQEARKIALIGPDGQLKDPSMVDPTRDYASEAVEMFPERTTTREAMTDFVKNSPMVNRKFTAGNDYGGVRTKHEYSGSFHPWDLPLDESNMTVNTDKNGDITGLKNDDEVHTDKDGNKYSLLNNDKFEGIMRHNHGVANYVRGQVKQQFEQAGGKVPDENTEDWRLAARHFLRGELSDLSKSTINRSDVTQKAQFKQKQEAGVPLYKPKEEKNKTHGILD